MVATYWKTEENKLKKVWMSFSDNEKKSNKKSIDLLYAKTKTRISYRKLEEYIRKWRKDT